MDKYNYRIQTFKDGSQVLIRDVPNMKISIVPEENPITDEKDLSIDDVEFEKALGQLPTNKMIITDKGKLNKGPLRYNDNKGTK